MNPLTNMKNVTKLSEQELYSGNKTSWHDQYRDSAWLFIGGLPFDLTEGDIICIFSQYGEVVNINLIRDKDSGKSKGFCFLCYEDQRSTDLAVDNLNGIKVLNRAIRVDHVSKYKVPKQGKKTDEETKKLYDEGCAPKPVPAIPIIEPVKIKTDPDDFRETLADQIHSEIKLPQRLPIYQIKQEKVDEEEVVVEKTEKKKHKKEKKKKKKKKSKKADSSDSDSSSDENSDSDNRKSKKKRKKAESDPEKDSKKKREPEDKEFRDRSRDKSRKRSRSRTPDRRRPDFSSSQNKKRSKW